MLHEVGIASLHSKFSNKNCTIRSTWNCTINSIIWPKTINQSINQLMNHLIWKTASNAQKHVLKDQVMVHFTTNICGNYIKHTWSNYHNPNHKAVIHAGEQINQTYPKFYTTLQPVIRNFIWKYTLSIILLRLIFFIHVSTLNFYYMDSTLQVWLPVHCMS